MGVKRGRLVDDLNKGRLRGRAIGGLCKGNFIPVLGRVSVILVR